MLKSSNEEYSKAGVDLSIKSPGAARNAHRDICCRAHPSSMFVEVICQYFVGLQLGASGLDFGSNPARTAYT